MLDKAKDAIGGKGDSGGMGDIQNKLGDLSFPASKDDVVSTLQDNNADSSLIDRVKSLAQDKFNSQGDLMQSLGIGK